MADEKYHAAAGRQEGIVRDVTGGSGMVLDHLPYDSYGDLLCQTRRQVSRRARMLRMLLDLSAPASETR